jgi:peptidoglycan/LPS O-acetylase OafA/YrhL
MADSHEIRALTGIRGVASVWVVCHHFLNPWLFLFPAISWIELPLSRGHLAVDLFFMLSGFILSYVYSVGSGKFGLPEYGKFLWYRLARIYPNHVTTLGVTMALVICARLFHIHTTGSNPWSHLPFQFTLTQVWPFAPGIQGGEWVGASWSISAEWFAYIFIFPLVAFVQRRRWHSLTCLALGYGVLYLWVFCCGPLCYYLFVSVNLLKAICEFTIGGFFFSIYLNRDWITRACQQYVLAFVVILIVLICFTHLPDQYQELLTLAFYPLLLIGLTTEASWPGWFLSTPLILWLGRVSYALYMSHGVIIRVLKILFPWDRFAHSSLSVRATVMAINLVAILIAAAALHYFVEVPARNYMRKKRPWH